MKKKLDVTELKKREVKLLNVLDDFCRNHDLCYFLAYGTLIGAMRHKGFIPWDDDIDVIMPRTSYEKLINTFNKESGKGESVRLISHRNDDKYYLPIAKLTDCSTVLKEDVDVNYEIGVYLDIFPLENLSDSLPDALNRMKKGFRYNQELMIKTIKWRKGRSLIKNLALVAGKIAFVRRPISKIIEELEAYCRDTQFDNFTKYVGVMSGISKRDDLIVFEKEWFEQTILVEFEGKQYPAPIGADALLRRIYGDYMVMPPKDQQFSHHRFEAWVKE